MGADIHFYVEKKVDGAWTFVYPMLLQSRDEIGIELEEDEEDDPNAPKEPDSPRQAKLRALYARYPGQLVDTYEETEAIRGPWAERSKSPFYLGRNYNLFAILADVRNGRGFAGVKTGEGFNPIADPKGVPDDATPEYKWEAERWEGDGHSHSYFTIRELLAYDWDQTTAECGWVSASEFKEFQEKGSPSCWSGGIGGYSVKKITNEEMAERVVSGDTAGCYTHVSWGVTYRSCAIKFLTETIPALQELGAPDDVRICFFFDN